jgi:DnaJ domain
VSDPSAPTESSEQPALPEPSDTALADTHANGLARNGALARPESVAPTDPGLYGVLGLTPSATDAEIQSAYRQQASKLLENGGRSDIAALRRLNTAYEVLGTPVRRAEYDRARASQPPTLLVGPPAPVRPDVKHAARVVRRRRPRQAAAPREAGLVEVLVVVAVVALSALVAWQLIPRLKIDLSIINSVSGVLPASSPSRRIIEATVTPAPAAATALPATPVPVSPNTDPAAELAAHFDGSTVTVASANPRTNSPQTVFVRLRRDGQPAANLEVWSTVQYRTTQERWPTTGSQRTDAAGSASISFNVGPATPGYPVEVHVFALVDGQQLSWTTTFTPR